MQSSATPDTEQLPKNLMRIVGAYAALDNIDVNTSLATLRPRDAESLDPFGRQRKNKALRLACADGRLGNGRGRPPQPA